MRSLIVGDIHTKFEQILPIVNKAIAENQINEVVLLGDYVDEWCATISDNIYGLEMFSEWLQKTRANGINVEVLIGNHDYAYISNDASCSGHMEDKDNKIKNLFLFDIKPALSCVVQDKYLCSHAGFLSGWCKQYVLPQRMDNIIDFKVHVNSILYELFYQERETIMEENEEIALFHPEVVIKGLYACGFNRGGYDQYSGPLWADKRELMARNRLKFDQIVGHTPVDTITTCENVTFCDTFSCYSNMEPIGDNSLLMIDEGDLKIINVQPT